MKAFTVVAHIDRNHLPAIGQPPLDRAPVARRAKQPVNDEKRGKRGGIAMGDKMQHDNYLAQPHEGFQPRCDSSRGPIVCPVAEGGL